MDEPKALPWKRPWTSPDGRRWWVWLAVDGGLLIGFEGEGGEPVLLASYSARKDLHDLTEGEILEYHHLALTAGPIDNIAGE